MAMMSQITSSQLLLEVTQLQQKLAQINQQISNMPIAQQLPAVHQVAVTERQQFLDLQEKVQAFYSKTVLFNIDECVQISLRLTEASTHLKSISKTQEKLFIYNEIYSDAEEALTSTRSDRNERLRLVMNDITQTMAKNHFNHGISLALTDLQEHLSRAILREKKKEAK